MKNTKLLQVKPKSGLLSELQSDTIYGHFCWRLKERFGDEKLQRFINSYRDGSPVFLLSDGLLIEGNDIRFPIPYLFKKPETQKKKSDKILEFVKRKNSKENKYISLDQLNQFLSSSTYEFRNNKKENRADNRPLIEEQLRVSVQIDRRSLSSSEGKLFSYNPQFFREDLSYGILVKILDEKAFADYECESLLKELFETGYGKKKSSGYGSFEVLAFSPFDNIKEPDDADSFIVLGNYLPGDDDKVEPLGYELNTKYGKFGEQKSQSDNPFKNPMTLLTAGSCFKTSNSRREFYGRVTDESEISDYHREAVQFGCPYFLKFKRE